MNWAATRSATTGSTPSCGQQVEVEPRPDDRRRAQRAFRFWWKPIDARGDGRLQRGRHTHLSNLCRRHVCARLPAQHTTLGQFAHDLLGEKRITGGPARRSSGPARRPRGPARAAPTTSAAVSESLSGARAMVCAPATRVNAPSILRAVGDQHQRGRLRDHGEEVGQHRLADLIDPMGVLNDIDRRGFAGQRRGIHQRGQPPPTRIRIDLPVRAASGSAMPSRSSKQQPNPRGLRREPGRALDRGRPARQDPRHRVAARSSRATAWKGTWLVCDSQKAVNTSTPRASRHRRHLAHQTALADARWPHHTDHRAVAVDCTVQQALNGGHLPPPTDQIRLSTLDSAMPFPHAQQPMGRDRLIGTLDLNQLRLAESRCAINQSRGGRAEHHPTRRSDRLHPLRHPHLLTDGGVTERPRTDLTGDHLTGVQARPAAAVRHRRGLGPRRQAASPPLGRPTPPGRRERRGPPTPPARRTPP